MDKRKEHFQLLNNIIKKINTSFKKHNIEELKTRIESISAQALNPYAANPLTELEVLHLVKIELLNLKDELLATNPKQEKKIKNIFEKDLANLNTREEILLFQKILGDFKKEIFTVVKNKDFQKNINIFISNAKEQIENNPHDTPTQKKERIVDILKELHKQQAQSDTVLKIYRSYIDKSNELASSLNSHSKQSSIPTVFAPSGLIAKPLTPPIKQKPREQKIDTPPSAQQKGKGLAQHYQPLFSKSSTSSKSEKSDTSKWRSHHAKHETTDTTHKTFLSHQRATPQYTQTALSTFEIIEAVNKKFNEFFYTEKFEYSDTTFDISKSGTRSDEIYKVQIKSDMLDSIMFSSAIEDGLRETFAHTKQTVNQTTQPGIISIAFKTYEEAEKFTRALKDTLDTKPLERFYPTQSPKP